MRSIVCPSGLAGEVRHLTGKEANILSDPNEVRSGNFLDKILSACWTSTTNPGPYELAPNGQPPWPRVLVGDRLYALACIRTESFGRYDFTVTCRSCSAPLDCSIDVTSDLTFKPLSEESRAAFVHGNRLETTMPGDVRKVTFRLPVGLDEQRANRSAGRSKKGPTFISALAARIVEIESVPETGKEQFLEDVSLKDLMALVAKFDEQDCGLDTKVDVECKGCGTTQEIELPFGEGFLAPVRG